MLNLTVKRDGTVWGWGFGGFGQLGMNIGSMYQLAPVQLTGFSSVVDIAVTGMNSYAVKSDGTVWALGQGLEGGLGNGCELGTMGCIIFAATAVQVKDSTDPSGFLTEVTAVAGGSGHALALKANGTVWAWDRGDSGQLGDGNGEGSSLPVQVAGMNDVVSIAAGGDFSLAVKSDGTVWSWGDNSVGQLGDGPQIITISPIISPVPVQVVDPSDPTTFLTNVVEVAAGHAFSMAMKSDGSVWAWGDNSFGQLGTGCEVLIDCDPSSMPVKVRDITGAVAISAGSQFGLAMVTDMDTDGISNREESGPGGYDRLYDGNGDGVPDREQDNVASFHTFDRQNYITLASPEGTYLTNVAAIENPSPGDAPAGVAFPLGFFKFTVIGVTPGGRTTVTISRPAGVSVTTYYKYGPLHPSVIPQMDPIPQWYEFIYDGTTGAEILRNRIVLHLEDGNRGDHDLDDTNGIIVEPGAPGLDISVFGRLTFPVAGYDDLPVRTAQVFLEGTPYSTFTDPNGKFQMPGVPAGNYTLVITAPKLKPVRKEITISPGQKLQVDLPSMTVITQADVDQAVTDAVSIWDADSDGRIGLAEAIRALQIVSESRSE